MKQQKNFSPLHKQYIKKEKRNKLIVLLGQIGFLVLIFFSWQLFADLKIIDSFIMGSPLKIWQKLKELLVSGELFLHLWISTKETLIGFILGTTIGTLIAVILWWIPILSNIFDPYLVVLNSLPKVALGPIIIIWVGVGQSAIITMAILISVIITTINMLNGFKNTDQNKVLLLKTMKASKFQIFFKLVLPANLFTLTTTLKINVGMAWIGTIMGEYLTSKAGLGYLILYGGQVFKLDLVMTCILVLCVVAGAMYYLLSLLEKILLRWQK